MAEGDSEKILRVLMRFGIDQSSANQIMQTMSAVSKSAKESTTQIAMSWREFVAQNMAEAMKLAGSQADAMKLLEKQWQDLKGQVKSTSDVQTKAEDEENARLAEQKARLDQVIEAYKQRKAAMSTPAAIAPAVTAAPRAAATPSALAVPLEAEQVAQVSDALSDEEHNLKAVQDEWVMLREQSSLTEEQTVAMIKAGIAGRDMEAQQILAVGRAYEQQRAAAQSAEKQEEDRLAAIEAHTKQIAQSFSSMIGLGRFTTEIGRAATIFGTLVGDDNLKRLGQFTVGIGDLIMALGRLPQALKALEGLGLIGQLGAAGLLFGGAAVIGQTAGRAYGAATGTTTAEEAGTALERVNQALQGMPAEQRAQEIAKLNASLEGLSTRDKVAVMNQFADALSSAGAETKKFIDTLDQFVKRAVEDTGKAIQKTVDEAKQNQDKLVTDFEQYQNKLTEADQKYGDERTKIEANTQQQIANEMQRFNDANITAYQNFRKQMQRADEDYANQVQNILAQAAQSEHKYEVQYYDERLKAAQKFGLEAARMEQQHQLEIQRMQQDHAKNLRKLAESRDALGIEDEMDRYETQRSRAEQDYQLQVQKRNQDYALQLQEMEQNFQAQRQQRTDDRAKQLADLAKQHAEDDARRKQDYTDQANERAKQFGEQLDKLKDDGQQKLDELGKQHQAERDQLAANFDQQRQDLGFFLDGEKALRDQKQQEMMVSLTNWFNQANKLITSTSLVTGMAANPPATSPYPFTYQAGGYTAGGMALMHPGEFVLNAQATRAAERSTGGALTQDRLISALDRRAAGGLVLNTPINLSLSFGGVSDPEQIKRLTEEAAYSAVARVGDKLHALMGAKV